MTKRHKRKMIIQLLISIAVVYSIVLSVVLFINNVKSVEASENNEIEDEVSYTVYESKVNDHNAVSSSANASNEVEVIVETPIETPVEALDEPNAVVLETTPAIIEFSRNLSEEDKYLLAKIAMAEAEGESIDTKIYVILTILNRADSEVKYFPNTIEEVIFQNKDGVYQFSPVMPNGRWWRIEPNEECWEAVEIVNRMKEDTSMGALYFEACKGESWHSRNLKFLFESDNTRFYK